MKKQLIVLASPSGGGKSTIAKHIRYVFPDLMFSVSVTTRQMRPGETDGKEYYFKTKEEFFELIEKDEFIEYEEIFGNHYGTLKSEIQKAITNKSRLIFDIDVLGALSIKRLFPENALLIFIAPPSFEILESRLRSRETETDDQVNIRLQRAVSEMEKMSEFDFIIINDKLEEALREAEQIVRQECY